MRNSMEHNRDESDDNNGSLPKSTAVEGGAAEQGLGAHLHSAKEHVAQAAREARNGLGQANRAARDAVGEGMSRARPELSAAGAEVAGATQAAAEELQAQWEGVLAASAKYVREHPVAALGLAAAGGYLLSRLLRA